MSPSRCKEDHRCIRNHIESIQYPEFQIEESIWLKFYLNFITKLYCFNLIMPQPKTKLETDKLPSDIATIKLGE